MEKIKIECKTSKVMPYKIDIEVDIQDFTEAINQLPMPKRWNHVAQILNGVETNLDEMTTHQNKVVAEFLIKKLALFQA